MAHARARKLGLSRGFASTGVDQHAAGIVGDDGHAALDVAEIGVVGTQPHRPGEVLQRSRHARTLSPTDGVDAV
jgi:hypothetical protein